MVTAYNTRTRVGSSPLTRGKRGVEHSAPPSCRLIPAHAGKTSPNDRLYLIEGAHPRSRGENFRCVDRVNGDSGSSPLTRGKQRSLVGADRLGGLIPAHAGKTGVGGRACARRWAHPRSRGENPLTDSESARATGSSPLTRGKQAREVDSSLGLGLIPAHAGKTP